MVLHIEGKDSKPNMICFFLLVFFCLLTAVTNFSVLFLFYEIEVKPQMQLLVLKHFYVQRKHNIYLSITNFKVL